MATKQCPICDWANQADRKTIEIDDKTITVCRDDCVAKVRANPEMYWKPA